MPEANDQHQPPANASIDFVEELSWRGLLKDCTDQKGLAEHLTAGTRRAYCGFDPTADSLTIGNLVPIMALVHFARAGHQPIVVMGGGTGLIGDPSGKSAERQLMTAERVQQHVDAQRPIFERVFAGAGLAEPTIRNNLDWLGSLGYLEALRDIGKHMSVNRMIQKDSVKARLTERDQGISYTEFSYMVLQAFDFLTLFVNMEVTLQLGGSDQWGNIAEGIELIHHNQSEALVVLMAWLERVYEELSGGEPLSEESALLKAKELRNSITHADRSSHAKMRELAEAIRPGVLAIHEMMPAPSRAVDLLDRIGTPVFGLTAPLVTKADGGKFGKTETGAVWLTPERTSPYAYYQFWLNAADADVFNFLRTFTLLTRDEIAALETAHTQDPGAREPHRALARAATELLHGREQMELAEKAGKALFSGELAELPEATLNEVFAEIPSSEHARADLDGAGDEHGVDPIALLVSTGLATSNRQAREFLGNGSVSVNGRKIDAETRLGPSDLLYGSMMALRRGKKSWHLTRWR